MASLGSLVIELAANTAKLQSDMGKAVGIVERGANGMKNAMGRLGAIATGGLIAKLGLDAIEFGDNLNKAAIKAGVSGKAISELAYAAKQSDVDLSSLSTALRKMQIAMSEAGNGSKQPIQALAALGLTLTNLKALSPDQQFELLADRISRLKDPADRARAATELFGKAGADLLPMFEQGAAGIRSAREEAQRLGQSFGDETLKRLADADDSIKRLKSSFSAFALTATAELAPALSKTLDNITAIATGDKILRLRADIDFLQRMSERGGGYLAWTKELGYGWQSAADAAERMKGLQLELDRITAPKRRPGGRERPASSPGFATGADLEIDAVSVTAKHIDKTKLLAETNDYLFAKYIDGVRASIAMEQEWASITAVDTRAGISDAEDAWDALQSKSDDAVEQTFTKLAQMTVYAEQAARNMQDALAQFLFDPFHDGLDGMLRGFIDTIRKMVAETAAAKIFGSKKSGGLGLGDAIGSFTKSLFGFANGGSILPGGSGGIDSQVVAFRKSPSEQVDIYTPGQRGGGGTVVHMHNDFRGATVDAIKYFQQMVPSIVQAAIDGSRRAVKDDFSRGAMRR